jgi:ADP-heptose:LPS heptosyltransferase
MEFVVGCAGLCWPPARAQPPLGRVFVLRNNDLGDVLTATPLLAALRAGLPDAHIAVGVGEWSRPLLANSPDVDEVVTVNAPWFNRRAQSARWFAAARYLSGSEVRAVRAARYDVGIDFLGSSWGMLLLMAAKIPYRLTTAGYAGGAVGASASVPYLPGEHVALAGLRFAELLGLESSADSRPRIFLSEEERAKAEGMWSSRRSGAGVRVLVGPGGGVAARRWPADRFAGLVARLSEIPSVRLLVTTGPGEDELAGEVVGSANVQAVQPPLRELLALAASSDFVVCNSSLLLHAAAAFQRPGLVLLGPAFRSVAEHDAQWSYPGFVTLGAEGGSLARPLASSEAAFERFSSWLVHRGRGVTPGTGE